MLPRPSRFGIAYLDSRIVKRRPHEIRYQAICRPVAPPNDVAGSHRGKRSVTLIKERAAVRSGNQFSTALAAAVRVQSAHWIIFPVTAVPLADFVALVARDIDHRAHAVGLTHRLEQMDSAHDVRRIGAHWILVRGAHQ